MRITQIVQKPQRRGAEIFADQLVNHLRDRGHILQRIYLYPYHGPNTLTTTQEDILLNGNERASIERIVGFHPQLLRRLCKEIYCFGPDLVQVNGARTVKYGALAHLFMQRERWPVVYRNIGNPADWLKGAHQRAFYQHVIMPNIGGIVGVSRKTLDSLQDFYRLSIPMIHIVGGVEPVILEPHQTRREIRESLQVANGTPVVIFVGSLAPEKRLDRFVRVIEQVRKTIPNAEAWIIGDGSQRDMLTSAIEKCGMRAFIKLLGSREDVGTYLNAADALLLTSDTEGTPGVILEAGWLERPVVATDVGGVPECVRHGETGFIAAPNEEGELAGYLSRLLQDETLRQTMGIAHKALIAKSYTMDQITDRYLQFYEQVLTHAASG